MTGALIGKVALVTGASRSIGAAIAKRLAADGAAVALTYGSSADKAADVVRAIQGAGGRALAIAADAADAEAVRAAVAKTVETFGRLDILVNNAGTLVVKPVDAITLEEFDRIMAVNVRGLFVATQEAVRHMGQGGRIINIGSINSTSVPFAGALVVRDEQSGRGRADQGPGARPRPARHHGQQRPAGTDGDRHEPGDGSVRRRGARLTSPCSAMRR